MINFDVLEIDLCGNTGQNIKCVLALGAYLKLNLETRQANMFLKNQPKKCLWE